MKKIFILLTVMLTSCSYSVAQFHDYSIYQDGIERINQEKRNKTMFPSYTMLMIMPEAEQFKYHIVMKGYNPIWFHPRIKNVYVNDNSVLCIPLDKKYNLRKKKNGKTSTK